MRWVVWGGGSCIWAPTPFLLAYFGYDCSALRGRGLRVYLQMVAYGHWHHALPWPLAGSCACIACSGCHLFTLMAHSCSRRLAPALLLWHCVCASTLVLCTCLPACLHPHITPPYVFVLSDTSFGDYRLYYHHTRGMCLCAHTLMAGVRRAKPTQRVSAGPRYTLFRHCTLLVPCQRSSSCSAAGAVRAAAAAAPAIQYPNIDWLLFVCNTQHSALAHGRALPWGCLSSAFASWVVAAETCD